MYKLPPGTRRVDDTQAVAIPEVVTPVGAQAHHELELVRV